MRQSSGTQKIRLKSETANVTLSFKFVGCRAGLGLAHTFTADQHHIQLSGR